MRKFINMNYRAEFWDGEEWTPELDKAYVCENDGKSLQNGYVKIQVRVDAPVYKLDLVRESNYMPKFGVIITSAGEYWGDSSHGVYSIVSRLAKAKVFTWDEAVALEYEYPQLRLALPVRLESEKRVIIVGAENA